MYQEFYLKNLDDYSFNPSIAKAISDIGLSVLSRTKNTFRVISNQRYTASVTYTIEFDENYKLRSIIPAANTQTVINLLFYLSNYYMNTVLEKFYTYDFYNADDKYLEGFIKELISCDLQMDKLIQVLNYISTSSKRPIPTLLKIYFKNLEKYYFYNQLLTICNDILEKTDYSEVRSVVINEFFSLLEIDDEDLTFEQTNKRNAMFDKFTDEELLSILNDEYKMSLLHSNDFLLSEKIDSLINSKNLKTINELIDVLSSSYIDQVILEDAFSYFTLAIYFSKKTRKETEDYLSRHLTFKTRSALILFENYGIIDLICQNNIYTPILNCLATYLYKSTDALNSKYHNMFALLNYMVNKFPESKDYVCRYVNRNFPSDFHAIFNCLVDNENEEDVDIIYYNLKENLLYLCPTNLLSKVLTKVNSYYEDYLVTLYKNCKDNEILKSIFLGAIINTDVSVDNLFNDVSYITTENITKTPLIILLEERGKLEEVGIKKVDL